MLQKGESINCQQMGHSRSLIRWRVVHASELIPGFVTFVGETGPTSMGVELERKSDGGGL